MTTHEVMVKLGLDNTTLQNGLIGAKQKITHFASDIKRSFKEAFHHLLAPLSIGGTILALHQVTEKVKALHRMSESTGLDTGVLQDLLNIGKAAGVSEGAIEKMMNKFTAGLKPGADPEQEMFKIADRLSRIEDPGERARVAIEAFGKSGAKLIPILKDGADGVRKLGEEFGKFSEEEIEDIEHAHLVMEKTQSKLGVLVAHQIEGIKGYFNAVKEGWKNKDIGATWRFFFGSHAETEEELNAWNLKEQKKAQIKKDAEVKMKEDGIKAADDYEKHVRQLREGNVEGQEKIVLLTQDLLEARRELEDMADQPEKKRYEQMKKIAEIEDKIADTKKRSDKEAADKAKDLAKSLDAQIKKLRADIKGDLGLEQFMPSIEDLAKSGFTNRRGRFFRGPFAREAQSILDLGDQAKRDFEWGNTNWAKMDVAERNRRYDRLADMGIVPQRQGKAIESQIKMEEHLKALVEKRATIKTEVENVE